jgi:hypothetical protein
VFTAVENEAAPVYERLVADEMPKGGDREAFAQFLAIMYARSKGLRTREGLAKVTHPDGRSAVHPPGDGAAIQKDGSGPPK